MGKVSQEARGGCGCAGCRSLCSALQAGNKPMSTYTCLPGKRRGGNWSIPRHESIEQVGHVAFDGNFCQTFVHAWLATLPGDKGTLTLFGKKPEQHRLFAEYACLAEALAEAGRRHRELRRR